MHTLEPAVKIRTYDPTYIGAVDQWWDQLLPYLKSSNSLYQDGGSVIMVQMENEYGSFGNVASNPLDKQYMEHLVAKARQHLGNDVVLYTTDGGSLGYMTRGSLNGSAVYTTGDFGPGSNPAGSFAAQDAMNSPEMRGAHICSEFYSGWLTHWGESMANTSSSGFATALDQLFGMNGSVSMYMGHGGTSFGRWAGANGGGDSYEPDITSYDYDSPLSEGGDHNYGSDGVDKFAATQSVLLNWTRHDGGKLPAPEEPALGAVALGPVVMTEAASLLPVGTAPAPYLGALGQLCTKNATSPSGSPPLSFEQLGMPDGLLWATAPRPGPSDPTGSTVDIGRPNDRGQIFVDGAYAGFTWRPEAAPVAVSGPGPASSPSVGVLLEDMGRLNYGGQMYDKKGFGPAVVPGAPMPSVTSSGSKTTLSGPWDHCAMPLDDNVMADVVTSPVQPGATWPGVHPTVFRGSFPTPAAGASDTYLAPYGWGKGYVWLNGYMLGRYWDPKGPQHTLYTPAALMRPAPGASNELIVLELKSPNATLAVASVAEPDFKHRSTCSVTTEPAEGALVVTWDVNLPGVGGSQLWTVPAVGTPGPVSLYQHPTLCMQAGPAKDPSTGQPAIQLGKCSPGDAKQTFVIDKSGAITLGAGGPCVDLTAHKTDPGSGVETYACNGGDNQQWPAKPAPGGGARLVSALDGQGLTACTNK